MIATLAFYMFAITMLVAGLLVVFARNPVHSVLWLILAFFSAAGLFVLMGAEFLAMLLMIVYVGAVAVLFLFVVMMLDVDFAELRGHSGQYAPIAALIGVVLFVELFLGVGAWREREIGQIAQPAPEGVPNAHAIGQILYTDYFYAFQASGLILLVAMIGAIVLTLRHRTNVKRQDVLKQMYRERDESVELKDVQPGQGI